MMTLEWTWSKTKILFGGPLTTHALLLGSYPLPVQFVPSFLVALFLFPGQFAILILEQILKRSPNGVQ